MSKTQMATLLMILILTGHLITLYTRQIPSTITIPGQINTHTNITKAAFPTWSGVQDQAYTFHAPHTDQARPTLVLLRERTIPLLHSSRLSRPYWKAPEERHDRMGIVAPQTCTSRLPSIITSNRPCVLTADRRARCKRAKLGTVSSGEAQCRLHHV